MIAGGPIDWVRFLVLLDNRHGRYCHDTWQLLVVLACAYHFYRVRRIIVMDRSA